MRPIRRGAVILGLGFLAAIAMFLSTSLLAGPEQTHAGAPVYIVNSTADQPDASLPDPVCEIDPISSQKCSLRAAIEQANEEGKNVCTPCVIRFDASVFPAATPVTVPIDADKNTGQGPLPKIKVPLTIDGTGAGVVLEPKIKQFLDYGLFVQDETPANPTDFTLIGNSFTIRGFQEGGWNLDTDGEGIMVCGDLVAGGDCDGLAPVVNVTIDGTTVALNGDDAIEINGEKVTGVVITDNVVFGSGSEDGGDALDIDGGDSPVEADILRNNFHAVDSAVDVNGTKCLVEILSNTRLTGLEEGVELHCDDGSELFINDNGDITGGDDEGIDIDVGDDSIIGIERNGDILGGEGEGAIDIDDAGIGLTLRIVGNGEILGGYDGIYVDADTGADITIQNNSPAGSITGMYDAGIYLYDLGDGSNVDIINNGPISGGDYPGIYIHADDNLTVNIDENSDIQGWYYEGITIHPHDQTLVNITDNGDIVGWSADSDGIGVDMLTADDMIANILRNGDIIGGYYGVYVTCTDDITVTVEDQGVAAGEAEAAGLYPSGSIIGGEYGIYWSTDNDATP